MNLEVSRGDVSVCHGAGYMDMIKRDVCNDMARYGVVS